MTSPVAAAPSVVNDAERPAALQETTLEVPAAAPSDLEKGAVSEKVTEKATPARKFQVSYIVRAGGATLAFTAGIVNSVAFYALSTFVSHLTGALSKGALGMYDSETAGAVLVVDDSLLLVTSFVIGSTITGLLIAKDTIHFGMALYDLCLITETALLIATTCFHEHRIARYLAAAACGLQNGMATHWGGAVIRTTHVTGLFTDVGLLTGGLLSIFCRKRCGKHFDEFDRAYVDDHYSKLSVLLMIAVAFFLGVFSGAHLYNIMEHFAFLVPACITGTIGLAYSVYRVAILRQTFFSDAEMEMVDVPCGLQMQRANDADGVEDQQTPKSMKSNGSLSVVRTQSWEMVSISRMQAVALEASHTGLDLHHQPCSPSTVSMSRKQAHAFEASPFGAGSPDSEHVSGPPPMPSAVGTAEVSC